MRDISSCNTFNYGDALYWDSRYVQEAGSFDWYQQYSALQPLIRHYLPTSSRLLMVGCGNAVISDDMVKDGYEEIVNVDISSVAIQIMKRKYEHVPQLKYLQMDVRDMSALPAESFDGVIDKGTLDSLMCGADALTSSSQMLGEVNRLLKPGGSYIMITYGDPTVRMPCLKSSLCNWTILLYIIRGNCGIPYVIQLPLLHTGYLFVHTPVLHTGESRPGFQKPPGSTSTERSSIEQVPLTEEGLLPREFTLEDPDCHFIYVCQKTKEITSNIPSFSAEDLS